MNAIKAAVNTKDSDTIRSEAQRLQERGQQSLGRGLLDAAEILDAVGADRRSTPPMPPGAPLDAPGEC